MNILVTGAYGQLGSELKALEYAHNSLTFFSRMLTPWIFAMKLGWKDLSLKITSAG